MRIIKIVILLFKIPYLYMKGWRLMIMIKLEDLKIARLKREVKFLEERNKECVR